MKATKVKIIGSNYNSTDASWRRVLANPSIYVDMKMLYLKVLKVQREVAEASKTQRLGLAWSGGKDSVVLHHILKDTVTFEDIQFATFTKQELYFPDTQAWFVENTPAGTRKIDMGIDSKKLSTMMFPPTSVEVKKWLTPKWKIFEKEQRNKRLDWTIFGRRIDDGNKIIKEKFESKRGMKTWCPLMEWSNEEIAAYISNYNVSIAPDYYIENGFKYGLCVWPLTDMATVIKRWPSLVGNRVTISGELIF